VKLKTVGVILIRVHVCFFSYCCLCCVCVPVPVIVESVISLNGCCQLSSSPKDVDHGYSRYCSVVSGVSGLVCAQQ